MFLLSVLQCPCTFYTRDVIIEHELSLYNVADYGSVRPYLHARAQSLQVSKVQALPAGIQTLHHTVRLHTARTHCYA